MISLYSFCDGKVLLVAHLYLMASPLLSEYLVSVRCHQYLPFYQFCILEHACRWHLPRNTRGGVVKEAATHSQTDITESGGSVSKKFTPPEIEGTKTHQLQTKKKPTRRRLDVFATP